MNARKKGSRKMKLMLKKIAGGLIPSLPMDEEKLSKWKFGSIMECEVKKPRNGQFHRKFFALINVVYINQEKYTQLDDLLVEVKLKTGHYKEHLTTKGEIIYLPKSISFAQMDEMEFGLFYSKVIDVVLKHFMKVSPEELDTMVNEVLSFS
jgi:hypothetical protein